MGITYGFEAEFMSGASALIASLHRNGWSSMDRLHDWHCEQRRGPCDHCSFEGGNRRGFRGQTDSSCNGEIISPVFGRDDTDDDFFTEASTALQENAVEVDAEPGLSAGMHVHVKPRDPLTMPDLLWEFIRWEHVIKVLATGPFSEHRSMNTDVATYAQTWFDMYSRGDFSASARESGLILVAMNSMVDGDRNDRLRQTLHTFVTEQDRHANLAFSQTHGTAELRVWNSTRSAWRMRMYTSVSRLFANPEFLDLIGRVELEGEHNSMRGTFTPEVEANIAKFIETAQEVDPQAAELMERQRDFQHRGTFARTFHDNPESAALVDAQVRRARQREERFHRNARDNASVTSTTWDVTVPVYTSSTAGNAPRRGTRLRSR